MSELGIALVAGVSSVFISSIAGYGGSLLLVPALVVVVGPKEGVALAALVLGWNNVFKVIAYRHTLALRAGWALLVVTVIGVSLGSRLLISAPDRFVVGAVVSSTMLSLAVDCFATERALRARRHAAIPAMAASAFLSGVSGTSGPLKGIAVRSINLPRLEHVGLASSVSLVADALKVELFASAGLLANIDLTVILVLVPVMPVGAWVGRSINRRMGEAAFRWVFWSVVGGYTLRMVGLWF